MDDEVHEAADHLHAKLSPIIERRQDVYIGILSTLLRFQTVSGERPARARKDDPAFGAAWRFIAIECERLDLDLRVYEDGEAGIIEWAGTDRSAPTLGVATHLDVVPPVGTWHHPPFGGTVVDGQIWGRGAQDDKGPIAMVLAAIDALKEMGFRPRRTIQVLIGTHEETEDWPDMDLLLEAEGRPDEVLVPDGAFPLGVGEKGIVTVEWAAEWPRRDGSDSVLHFVGLDGGARANVVPGEASLRFDAHVTQVETAEDVLEAASLRISRAAPHADVSVVRGQPTPEGRVPFEVAFVGRPAHAAFPQDGHNAVLDALAFLTLVPELPPQVALFSQFLYEHTHSLDAAALGIALDHAQMGATTLNLGRLEMDVAGAHAHINVRFPKGLSARDVENACRTATRVLEDQDRHEFEVHTRLIGRPQPPFLIEGDAHEAFLAPLEAAYQAVTGVAAKRLTIAGTTYAKLFPLAVGFGPVDLVRHEPVYIHRTDERVSVERHLENVRIYAVALGLLAGEPDSDR